MNWRHHDLQGKDITSPGLSVYFAGAVTSCELCDFTAPGLLFHSDGGGTSIVPGSPSEPLALPCSAKAWAWAWATRMARWWCVSSPGHWLENCKYRSSSTCRLWQWAPIGAECCRSRAAGPAWQAGAVHVRVTSSRESPPLYPIHSIWNNDFLLQTYGSKMKSKKNTNILRQCLKELKRIWKQYHKNVQLSKLSTGLQRGTK